MANHIYYEFHQQLQSSEGNRVQQMTARRVEPPLTVACTHCGCKAGITSAELHYWPGRSKGLEHGWVAVCPKCGTRLLPNELNHLPVTTPIQNPVPPYTQPDPTPTPNPEPPTYIRLQPVPKPAQKPKMWPKILLTLVIIAALLFAGQNVLRLLSFSKNSSSGNTPVSTDTPNTGTNDTTGTEETEEPITDGNGNENTGDNTDTQDVTGEETVEMESYYEVFVGDISWYDAMTDCSQMTHNGVSGHLATITSAEEYEKVVQTLEEYCDESGNDSLNYIWLGAINDEDSCRSGVNNFTWITGESWSYDKWCNAVTDDGVVVDEPSFIDEGNDNAIEECLALWGFKHDELGWTFSDQNGNLPEVYPSACGKIGYICEYDESEQVEVP